MSRWRNLLPEWIDVAVLTVMVIGVTLIAAWLG